MPYMRYELDGSNLSTNNYFQTWCWLKIESCPGPTDKTDKFSPDQVDDNSLFKFFATSLSSCKSAKVVTEQNGQSKGFGFVRFSMDDDAKKAISSFNLMAGLGKNRIRVCKAFPKQ